MVEKILLVDSDVTTLAWLQSKLTAAGYSVETANRGDAALAKITQTPAPNIVVLDLTLPDMDGLELIRHLRSDVHLEDFGIIVLSQRAETEDILAGLNAGADHFIRKRPGADVELIANVRARLAQPKKNVHGGRGRIFSFCSAKGGTGTTSICINTACALAKLDPKAEILIVDMVFPLGSVGIALGYESRQTISKLSQESKEKIDLAIFERYSAQTLRWGFRVMLGANDPQEASGFEVHQVIPIFERFKTMYDYILVDFGKTLSRISLPIIERSSALAIIVTPDISTVKASHLMLNFLDARNVNRNRIILINNRTVGRVWTTAEDIERELKMPLNFTIPYVVEYMTMAINAGVPFMEKFPDSAACMAFMDIARLLTTRDKNK